MNSFDNDVIQLIQSMVNVFQHKRRHKPISDRIRRGRVSASSSNFEEGLAKLIAKHTPDDVELFVDFPMSFQRESAKRVKTIYPDIAVVRFNSLIAMVEAKIDLGYMPPNWIRSRKQTFNELLSASKVIADDRELTVSKRFVNASVVLTAQNDHGYLEQFIKETDNSVVLLSADHLHPNDGKVIKKPYIAEIGTKDDCKQWRRLERFIVRYLK